MDRGIWLQSVGSQRIRYNWATKFTPSHAHKNHPVTPILPVFSCECILPSCLKSFFKRSLYKIKGEKLFFFLKACLLRCFENITSGDAELKCLGPWVCLKAFFFPILFYFLLKYSWFTMLCWSLLYRNMTQLFTYTHSFLNIIFHYVFFQLLLNKTR